MTNATIHYLHSHDYTALPPVVTKEPTCTETGLKEYTCIYGGKKTEVLPALGHEKGNVIAITPATCTKMGYTTYACTRCGGQFAADHITALGHDYTGPVTTKPATCEETGAVGPGCTRCDSVREDEVLPALGHNVVVIPAKEPTCTEYGATVGTHCDRCKEVFIQPTAVPKLGHDYANGICTRCPDGNAGEFDGDGIATDNDAYYLLRYTLFGGDRYPVDQNGDVDGDGAVTDQDALYLLRHALFPERYILYPKNN